MIILPFLLFQGLYTHIKLTTLPDLQIIMELEKDDRRWKLRPDVVVTVLNDGAVMLDLQTKFFFSVNTSAWAIAEMFEAGATQNEVREACARWGAVNGDKQVVEAMMKQLIAEGLVKPVEEATPPVRAVALAAWAAPTLVKHSEPLQRIMVSAFDPGLPLAE